MLLPERRTSAMPEQEQASRRSFATAELSEEKANAISASRMDARHAHLDAMLDDQAGLWRSRMQKPEP
jgi:hypothetical protein